MASKVGVAGGFLLGPGPSRGADLGDVDGDGLADLAVATARDGVRLLVADWTGHFADRSVDRGVARPTMGRSWYGVLLEDLDLDGDLDLVATGDPDLLVLANDGGRFSPAPAAPSGLPALRGAALLDLDEDGDPDLAVAVRGGGLRVLRNEATRPEWLRVLRPVYSDAPLSHPGARLAVRWPEGRLQVAEARRLRGWLSASDPVVRFARRGPLPAKEPPLTIQGPGKPELRVAWRGVAGQVQAPILVPGSER